MCVKLAAAGGTSLGRLNYADSADKAVAGTIRWKSYHFSRTSSSEYIFAIQRATPTHPFVFAAVRTSNKLIVYSDPAGAATSIYDSTNGSISSNQWNTCGLSWAAAVVGGDSTSYPKHVVNGNEIAITIGPAAANLPPMGGAIDIGGRAPVGGAVEGDRSSDALFKFFEYYKGIRIPVADMIAEDNGTLPEGSLRVKYAAWLHDAWDFTESTTSANGVVPSVGNTVAIQARTPGDVWGFVGVYDPRSIANTEASGRCAVAKDLSGCENDLAETASNGPQVVNDSTGIGGKRWTAEDAALSGTSPGARRLGQASGANKSVLATTGMFGLVVAAATKDIFGGTQGLWSIGVGSTTSNTFYLAFATDYALSMGNGIGLQGGTNRRFSSLPRMRLDGNEFSAGVGQYFHRTGGVTQTSAHSANHNVSTTGAINLFSALSASANGSVESFYGDIYYAAFNGRKPSTLTAVELAAIDAWETAQWGMVNPATWQVEFDGSSSMEQQGWGGAYQNRTMAHYVADACRIPRAYGRNWGTGGVRYATFAAGLANEITNANNRLDASIAKDHRLAVVGYGYGDLTGAWPNVDGIANLATLKSNYLTNVFTPLAAVFGGLVLLPILPRDTATDADHTLRQTDAEDWNAWLVDTVKPTLEALGNTVVVPRIDQIATGGASNAGLNYTGFAGANVGAKVSAMIAANLVGTLPTGFYADVTHTHENFWVAAESMIETAICSYMSAIDPDPPSGGSTISRLFRIDRLLRQIRV